MSTMRPILVATVVLAIGGVLFAQYQIHGGRELDRWSQQYNMRSEMGHALDNNLQVGGTGWNTPVGVTRTPYVPDRSFYQRSADYSRRQYSVPYNSDGVQDALIRSGRNPQANPYGRAYSQPPVGGQRIDGRAY